MHSEYTSQELKPEYINGGEMLNHWAIPNFICFQNQTIWSFGFENFLPPFRKVVEDVGPSTILYHLYHSLKGHHVGPCGSFTVKHVDWIAVGTPKHAPDSTKAHPNSKHTIGNHANEEPLAH